MKQRIESYLNKVNYMNKSNSAIKMYLTIMFVITYGLGVLEAIFQTGVFYNILHIGFTPLPVVTALIVRKRSGETDKFRLSLKVWNNWKMWLFSAFVPGVAIALGAVLYFLVFSNEYSGVFEMGALLENASAMEISNPLIFAAVCVLLSAVFIPLHLLELGEEIGWRGYLLWHQVEKYGAKKAVLINGIEWGLAHMPLIYLGFNYSSENFGAPWTNMAVMMLLCITMGIIFSYVTLKTGNCMYAAIMHGVVNLIGEIPVFCSVSLKSGLLGPNPTGVLSMAFLIVIAIILFIKLNADVKKDKA